MNSKRITYFDLAKGVGIILVVLGHMENISANLRIWIASFHMPLFFIISGMLIAAKNEVDVYFPGEDIEKTDIFKLITKKAKGILVPYFWFSIIYIPIDIVNLFILDNVDKHTFIQNILDSASLSGISVMWFLPALFIAEIVAVWIISQCGPAISNKLLVKCVNGNKKIIGYIVVTVLAYIISVLSFEMWSGIRPVYDANSENYVVCTLLGFIRVLLRGICMSSHVVTGFIAFKIISCIESTYINRKNDDAMKRAAAREIKGFSIAIGIIFFALNLGWCFKNEAVDNHFLTLNNLSYYYLCAFFGSMSIIFICKGLDRIGFIEFLGKNSLIIMATHLQCYLLYAGILIAIAIDTYVTRAKSYVYMFNSVLFTMLFEAVVIVIINRFFPFIIGKGKIKDIFSQRKDI